MYCKYYNFKHVNIFIFYFIFINIYIFYLPDE